MSNSDLLSPGHVSSTMTTSTADTTASTPRGAVGLLLLAFFVILAMAIWLVICVQSGRCGIARNIGDDWLRSVMSGHALSNQIVAITPNSHISLGANGVGPTCILLCSQLPYQVEFTMWQLCGQEGFLRPGQRDFLRPGQGYLQLPVIDPRECRWVYIEFASNRTLTVKQIPVSQEREYVSKTSMFRPSIQTVYLLADAYYVIVGP